jgi:hypothetical protein
VLWETRRKFHCTLQAPSFESLLLLMWVLLLLLFVLALSFRFFRCVFGVSGDELPGTLLASSPLRPPSPTSRSASSSSSINLDDRVPALVPVSKLSAAVAALRALDCVVWLLLLVIDPGRSFRRSTARFCSRRGTTDGVDADADRGGSGDGLQFRRLNAAMILNAVGGAGLGVSALVRGVRVCAT